ncbi:MAG: DUF1801 domain-containing protein [Chloroflexi bacterium]|nr:DUF1801 domain-containing protein [Chloroflexota bacterium]
MTPGGLPEVDAFLAALAEPRRTALQALREAIGRLVPEATAVMSNGIPTFIHFGPLVGFGPHASNRALCSLYVMQPKLLAAMRSAIAPHTVSGGTIHFAPDAPLAPALLDRIVRDRARENEAAHLRAAQRRK